MKQMGKRLEDHPVMIQGGMSEHAQEGLEYLVTNQIFPQYCPNPLCNFHIFFRAFCQAGDAEKDEHLRRRMTMLSWIKLDHLDLKIVTPDKEVLESVKEGPNNYCLPADCCRFSKGK